MVRFDYRKSLEPKLLLPVAVGVRKTRDSTSEK